MPNARASLLKPIFLSLLTSLLILTVHGANATAEYDTPAAPLKTPPPTYPDALKRAGISGLVAIRIIVDETGAVAEASVTKSSNPEFDQPAIDAVKVWKFKPAQKNGTAVKARLLIPIKFSLES